jgi:hypothetical protein
MARKKETCSLCKTEKRETEKVELKGKAAGGRSVLVCPVCDFAETGKGALTAKDVQG